MLYVRKLGNTQGGKSMCICVTDKNCICACVVGGAGF